MSEGDVWDPSLTAEPWRSISVSWVDERKFYQKLVIVDGGYEVLLTDLVNMWGEKVTEDNVALRCKHLNPQVEASHSRILDEVKSVTSGKFLTCVLHDTSKTTEKIWHTTSQLSGISFYWQFKMTQVSNETMSDQLTFPLVSMVTELMRRQDKLIQIIKKKDMQIDNFKKKQSQNTETSTFDPETFISDMDSTVGLSLMQSNWDVTSGELYQTVVKAGVVVGIQTRAPESSGTPEKDSQRKKRAAGSDKSSPVHSPKKSPMLSKVEELERRQELEKKLEKEQKKLLKQQIQKKKKLKI